MLAIEKKTKGHEGKCTPNVLPCRINHNGAVDASKRYWNPTQTSGKTCILNKGGQELILFLQMAKHRLISADESYMARK